MIKAVEAIFTMLLLFGAGAFLYKLGWVSAPVMEFISRFVVKFSVPCMMVWNLTNMFTHDELVGMLPIIPLPLLMLFLLYALSWGFAILCKVPRCRRGVFTLMSVVSNTLFIGFPVSLIVYGDASIPAVTVTFLSSTIICWTIGISGLSHDARCMSESGCDGPVLQYTVGQRLKKVVTTPPLVALVVGVALAALDWRLPSPLNNALSYVGGMTTPLSMLYIGMFLATIPLKEMVPTKASWAVFFCRFLLAPVLMYLFIIVGRRLGIVMDKLSADVLIIQMGMPVMAQAVILATDLGGDAKFAARTTAASNVVFLLTFPLTLFLLG
ncbi:MAG: AEC family transporter [Sphaerochaetaceae bacterium]|nr:AEC family transporter [Sphaerochaetaceae bacterium]